MTIKTAEPSAAGKECGDRGAGAKTAAADRNGGAAGRKWRSCDGAVQGVQRRAVSAGR